MNKSVILSVNAIQHTFTPDTSSASKPLQGNVSTSSAAKADSKPKSKSKKKVAGAALIGIDVRKDEDFPSWYQQVLLKGDMIDYYDVSGCYILKPYSWSIWESLQAWFDKQIKQMGVRNCSFPMFASEDVLQKEKDHIEGFAAEVAWVTQSGKTTLERKIAIRPTSETIMYPYYAKWIQSYRDLPLRLNQWNSVVRWEFKHPQPFLRSREFFWQEGHTAHLTRAGADKEVMEILDLYTRIYEDLLAVPIIPGTKTEKEKFAGGLYTTTVEGYIPATGRGIQGATSHGLGQNFSNMFGISVEDPSSTGKEAFVWQNSWAFSTRVIGVMVMVHGDDRGLVMPPKVAPIQVVIVPVGISVKTPRDVEDQVHQTARVLSERLTEHGFRVELDNREEYSPGYKFNHWELRGVPLRLEIGPGEVEAGFVTVSRRDISGRDKIPIGELESQVSETLDDIQSSLHSRAREEFSSNVKIITAWENVVPALNAKHLVLVPHCLTEGCEDSIKKLSGRAAEGSAETLDAAAPSMGAKSLCIPFKQVSKLEGTSTRCINPQCQQFAMNWCLFGRSY